MAGKKSDKKITNDNTTAKEVQKKFFKQKNNPSLAYPAKSIPLSQEEIERLEDYERLLPEEAKKVKKIRKPFALSSKKDFKVKKKFTSKANKKVYFIRKGEITNLRERYGDDFDSFKSSISKKKSLLTILIIVILVLAILGVGAYVGYTYIFKQNPENIVISGDITFNDVNSYNANINNVRLNEDIDKDVTITNSTNGSIYLRFVVNLKDTDNVLIDMNQYNIDVEYEYNSNYWLFDSDSNYLYFKGQLSQKDIIQVISAFKITSVDKNENAWANKSLQVEFNVECAEIGNNVLVDLKTKGWNTQWIDLMSNA